MLSFAVVVPTLNPGPLWERWLAALNYQTARPWRVLVIDSSSDDGQIQRCNLGKIDLITIPRHTFNHGMTRQWAFEQVREDVEVVVYLTQDAVLADNRALEYLIAAFNDTSIAAAYGRQLPRSDAGPFGAHARLCNYGPNSLLNQWTASRPQSIRTCFLSNSFAAYRCSDLASVGGFPETTFGEDMLVTARLLLDHRRIAYVAEARVFHSHDYSIAEEFARYYAIGQFHSRHPWLLDAFGEVSAEGVRFVISEAGYLLSNAPHLLPIATLRTLAKYLGYRMGRWSRQPGMRDNPKGGREAEE